MALDKTVLKLVQDVLESMDSDDVNSIDDTVEATSVANIAKVMYEEWTQHRDWPEHREVRQLVGLSDTLRPTSLQLPAGATLLDWFRYNSTNTSDTNQSWPEITYCDPDDFLKILFSRNTSSSDVTVFNTSQGVPLFIRTDAHPTYYTSFDDDIIICDSYKLTEDTTLQAGKTMVSLKIVPDFVVSDLHSIELSDAKFPAYRARVKAYCHQTIKQQVSPLDIEASASGKAKNNDRRSDSINSRATERNYGRTS